MHWQAAEIVKGATAQILTAAGSAGAKELAVADHADVWRRLASLALGVQIAIWRLRGTGEVAVGTQVAVWPRVAGRLSAAIAASESASGHLADARAILRAELGRDERAARPGAAAPEPGPLLAAVARAVADTDLFNSIPDAKGSVDRPGYYVTVAWIADALRDLAEVCWVEGETLAEWYAGSGARRRGARTRRAMQATGREWRRSAAGLDDALAALGREWLGFDGSGDWREL